MTEFVEPCGLLSGPVWAGQVGAGCNPAALCCSVLRPGARLHAFDVPVGRVCPIMERDKTTFKSLLLSIKKDGSVLICNN